MHPSLLLRTTETLRNLIQTYEESVGRCPSVFVCVVLSNNQTRLKPTFASRCQTPLGDRSVLGRKRCEYYMQQYKYCKRGYPFVPILRVSLSAGWYQRKLLARRADSSHCLAPKSKKGISDSVGIKTAILPLISPTPIFCHLKLLKW